MPINGKQHSPQWELRHSTMTGLVRLGYGSREHCINLASMIDKTSWPDLVLINVETGEHEPF